MDRKLFSKLVNERILFIDGAYGTEFFKRGITKGSAPVELLNITNPDAVVQLQDEYVRAGVDFLLTNTFSANRHKLRKLNCEDSFRDININAVKISKKAANKARECIGKDVYVLGDISSVGEMVVPFGELDSEYVYNVFKEQAQLLYDGGVDGFIIETMSDIKELKLAYLAVRDVTQDLPLLVSMTFEENGVSVTGTSLEIYASLFNDLDVDAIGMNCTLTAQLMVPLARKLALFSKKPIFTEPNAGKPTLTAGGRLVYKTSPEEFTVHMEDHVQVGVNIVGGCCGTGPEHINYMTKHLKDKRPAKRNIEKLDVISNRTYMVNISPFLIVGERINASGKKKFQEKIRNFDFENVLKLAREQENEGAQVLDINLGNETFLSKEHFRKVMIELDRIVSIPLSLDIQSEEFLETALFEYPGRPLINSSKATKEELDKKIALLKRFGGVLVILAMGNEIPKSAQERYKIGKWAVEYAISQGIEKDRIFVDPLVLPFGANEDYNVTLETIRLLSTDKIRTSIGLSNFSFGMPNRESLNASLLALAMERGLCGAILNTAEQTTMNILNGMKKMLKKEVIDTPVQGVENELVKFLIQGDEISADKYITSLSSGASRMSPLEIVQDVLTKAMEEIGKLYANNKIFLPHLILAAETVKPLFTKLSAMIPEGQSIKLGKVLLATVEGDIHDIGKKIVGTVLESAGFEVIDLGKDIPAQVILQKTVELKPDIVGLSAMMTTTVVKVGEVVKALKSAGIELPIIAGGASMNEELAKRFGCIYGKDAQQAVEICNELMKKTKPGD